MNKDHPNFKEKMDNFDKADEQSITLKIEKCI